MLDWSGRLYRDGQLEHGIDRAELGPALRTHNLQFSLKERFIRDCFESLFDQIELLEHDISIELIHADDASVPLAYYAIKISQERHDFEPFLDAYGYAGAKRFLLRASRPPADCR